MYISEDFELRNIQENIAEGKYLKRREKRKALWKTMNNKEVEREREMTLRGK